MLNLRANFKGSNEIMTCPRCNIEEDTEEHLNEKCQKVKNRRTEQYKLRTILEG